MQNRATPLIPSTSELLQPMFDVLNANRMVMADLTKKLQSNHVNLLSSILADFHKSINQSLLMSVRFSFPDIVSIPASPTKQVTATPGMVGGVLCVEVDQYGFYTIGDEKLSRANAISSRHGRLLGLLEGTRGELISDQQMKTDLKVTNPKQVMRDLKKELRQLGYRLSYRRLPRQGLVYKGVIRKQ